MAKTPATDGQHRHSASTERSTAKAKGNIAETQRLVAKLKELRDLIRKTDPRIPFCKPDPRIMELLENPEDLHTINRGNQDANSDLGGLSRVKAKNGRCANALFGPVTAALPAQVAAVKIVRAHNNAGLSRFVQPRDQRSSTSPLLLVFGKYSAGATTSPQVPRTFYFWLHSLAHPVFDITHISPSQANLY